jgi:hypothetical protein
MDAPGASWPPRWSTPGSGPDVYPPATWPTKGQIDYTRSLIVLGLLLLALPWIVLKLASSPGDVLGVLGRGAIEGSH